MLDSEPTGTMQGPDRSANRPASGSGEHADGVLHQDVPACASGPESGPDGGGLDESGCEEPGSDKPEPEERGLGAPGVDDRSPKDPWVDTMLDRMREQYQREPEEPLDADRRVMKGDVKRGLSISTGSADEVWIGNYRLDSVIGRGSFGSVHCAWDRNAHRKVALKLLHSDRSSTNDGQTDRMQKEARALAKLEHPNVVRLYHFDQYEDGWYMAMELVAGDTLAQIRDRDEPPGWETMLAYYVGAGRGLAAAHAQGVVHRDFKPQNVIIDAEGIAKVADFGLARITVNEELAQTSEENALGKVGALEKAPAPLGSKSSNIAGTPYYMAPEVFANRPADARSDQFSFCVALYEAVYGRLPFPSTNFKELRDAVTTGRLLPPPEERSNVPGWLFDVLTQGLSPDPNDRFSSMAELLDRLEPRRGVKWIAYAIALVLLAAAAVWGVAHWREQRREEERVAACSEGASQLGARWSEQRDDVLRWFEHDDVEVYALGPHLEQEMAELVDAWDASCVADPTQSFAHCREQVTRDLEGVLAAASTHQAPVGMFTNLTRDFAACLEVQPRGSCSGPVPDAQAPVALAAARGWLEVGESSKALEQAEHALGQAEQAGDRFSAIRARLAQGAALEGLGQRRDAMRALERALAESVACDAHVQTIDSALELVEVEALHGGEAIAADGPLLMVEKLLDRAVMGQLLLRPALYHEKAGDVALYLDDRCAEGIEHFKQALSTRQLVVKRREHDGLPSDSARRRVAEARLNLANAYAISMGGHLSGCEGFDVTMAMVLDTYRQAREEYVAATGRDDHPGRADFDFSIGAAHLNANDPDAARTSFHAALKLYERDHGDRSPLVADAHRALAAVEQQAGDLEAAREHAELNLQIRLEHEAAEGNPLMVAQAYDALGVIESESGLYREAVEHHRAAIERIVPPNGDDPEERAREQLVWSNLNLGIALRAEGRLDDTREAVTQAYRWFDTERDGERPPQLLLLEARLLAAEAQYADARARLQLAMDIVGEEGPPSLLFELRWELLQVLKALEQPMDAACATMAPAIEEAMRDGTSISDEARVEWVRWRKQHCLDAGLKEGRETWTNPGSNEKSSTKKNREENHQ